MAEETPQDRVTAPAAEDVSAWVDEVVTALRERLTSEGSDPQPERPLLVGHSFLAVLIPYVSSLIIRAENAPPIERMTPYYRAFCQIGWDPRQLLPLWNNVAQALIDHSIATERTREIVPLLQRLLQDANAIHTLATCDAFATRVDAVPESKPASGLITALPSEQATPGPHRMDNEARVLSSAPWPPALYDEGQRLAAHLAAFLSQLTTHLEPPKQTVASADETVAALGRRIEHVLGQLLLRKTRVQLYETLVVGLTEVDATTYPLLSGIARLGPTSITQLAHEVGLDRSGASRYATRLEEVGLITRVNNPADARAVALALTPCGHAVVEELRKRLAEYLADHLLAWPPGEAAQFVEAFEHFVADLIRGPQGGGVADPEGIGESL